MKKLLRLSIICFSLMLICLLIGACGEKEEPHTDISVTNDFAYADGAFKTTVSSTVETYDLKSKIEIFEKANMEISKSTSFDEILNGEALALEPGDNVFYVKISHKKLLEQVYKFNIYRNPKVNIQFNTNGGSSVSSLSVESGTLIEAPQSVKTGYDLRWDYNFSYPVTSDMTINAIWTPKNYKITIDSNDENVEDLIIDVAYDSAYDLSDKVQDKPGYRFSGFYYLDGDVEIEFSTRGTYTRVSDIAVYAKYESVEYSITYILEKGATNPNTVSKFTINDVVELLDAQCPEKIFAGWYTSDDYAEENKITQISNLTQSITLWAKFDSIQYKTSVECYDNNEIVSSYEFQYNSNYELAEPSAKKGYKFVGWYLNDELIEMSGVWSKKDSALKLTAKYSAIKNTIIYDLPNGAENNSANKNEYTIEIGTVKLEAPSFGNHIFEGWYLDDSYKTPIAELTVDNVTNGMTIYSKWQYVTNVKFDVNGGTSDKTEDTYKNGKEYTLPAIEKLGYVFDGWYYGDDKIESAGTWIYKDAEITLVAKFTVRKFNVEYVLPEGAENNSANPSDYNVENGAVKLENPSFGNNIFEGWYFDATYTTKVEELTFDIVNGGITLYSKWQYVTNVTFDKQGGTCDKTNDVFNYGKEYTLPTIEKTGYVFNGWYKGEEKVESVGTWIYKDAEIALTAKFTVRKFAVEYVLQEGAENNSANKNEYTIEMGTVKLEAPSFGNHIFEGWYSDATYTTKVEELTYDIVNGGITLYSKWQYVTNVIFDALDGACDKAEDILKYGKEYTLLSAKKEGYVFEGWYYGEEKIDSVGNWIKRDAEITLVAKYSLRESDIVYVLPDGAQNNSANKNEYTIEMGEVKLEDPSFGNHIFEGWYSDATYTTKVEELTYDVVNGGITLYSKWQYVTNVKFDVNGGTCDKTEDTYKNGKEYTLPTIEKKGYIFEGWYYNKEKVESSGAWSYKDAEIILVAKFTARKFNVEYDLPDGANNTDTNPNEYTIELGTVKLEDPSFGNHIFEGWYFDAAYTTKAEELTYDIVNGGITLYSKWQYVTNVTFDAQDGSCDKTDDTFQYGKAYILPAISKKGYIFEGWYYGEEKIETTGTWMHKDAEITLVAKFIIHNVNIKYDLPEGAENNIANKVEYNIEMGSVKLEDPSFGNHIFEGWYSDITYTTKVEELTYDIVSGGITLYSKWQYVTNVTFDAEDGTCDKAEDTLKYGKEYVLPVAKKEGYVFDGWYYGDEKIDSAGTWIKRDAEIILVAKYSLRESDIVYVLPDGAQNNSANKNEYTIEMGTVKLEAPSFGNHIFEGWYSDATYTTKVEELTYDIVNGGITLYSKWQYVTNVKFDLNGSLETIEDKQHLYGQTYTLPSPIKAGCLFEGWYYGDVKVTSGVWMYKDAEVTLVAHWIPTTVAINYVLNGGIQNAQNPETFDVYTGVIELKDPTIDNQGFSFDGWYTDSAYTNKVTSIDTAVIREITLYAKWVGISVQVTFDPASGYIAETTKTMVYGSTYSIPTPERAGYKFEGWYYNDQIFPQSGTWSILDSISLVAKWTLEKYTITYDLGGATESEIYDISGKDADGNDIKVPITFTSEYDVHSSDIIVPKLRKDGYIFLGWRTSTGYAQSITISSGSVGNRTYTAAWCSKTDSNGFVYELVDDHMVCVDYTATPSKLRNVDLPSYYNGYPVTTIASKAFSAFGVKYNNSSYKNASYYFTITLPKTITLIQENAFVDCDGICVSLRDENGEILDFKSAEELKEWEKTVDYGSTKVDKQMRDCIWGFRPAIGWTRFSAVEIPDDYE